MNMIVFGNVCIFLHAAANFLFVFIFILKVWLVPSFAYLVFFRAMHSCLLESL
uniref:Uncharacterized protein n=1 Tax=Solanum lycopersicum TaxID=4081 RepID=A0A3Q7FGN7_SOLLC